MKKTIFLILYLLFILLTFLFASTTFTGISHSAYIRSISLLAFLPIVFLAMTILFYKLYKKGKAEQFA